jgi:hypothetical protein
MEVNMPFDSDQVGGPLVIDGDKVKIFTKSGGINGSYTYINCSKQVTSASWVSDEIVIQFADGSARQYSSTGMYH